MSSGAPPGARSNGVPVSSWWAALGACDPRVTGEVLDRLAGAGIAAYAQPDGGARGSYLEVRPPHRPMDLLYVEGSRQTEADGLVRHRLGDSAGSEDAAFAAIIAGFHDPLPGADPKTTSGDGTGSADPPDPTWPTAAPQQRMVQGRIEPSDQPGLLDPGGLLFDSTIGDYVRPQGTDPFAGDDEHFVPPPVGKPPPVHPVTRTGIIAIVAGIALLVAPSFGLFSDATIADALGATLIVGGVAALLSRLHDEPPDEGPHDGAVV